MEPRSDALDRLAATNPLPAGARLDPATADRLFASIVAQPRRPAARRTPSTRLVVAAVVIALAAIPTLAFSDGVRSFLGWDSQSLPVFEKSRLLVSASVAESTVAHLWGSPSRTGGECFFVTFSIPPGKVEQPSQMTGGGACTLGPRSGSGNTMALSASIPGTGTAPPGAAAGVPPIVEGYVDPSLGATRVEIRWNGGSKELAYANGYFLGGVRALFDAPKELNPIRVIAYDAKGREVHRRDIDAAWFRIH